MVRACDIVLVYCLPPDDTSEGGPSASRLRPTTGYKLWKVKPADKGGLLFPCSTTLRHTADKFWFQHFFTQPSWGGSWVSKL